MKLFCAVTHFNLKKQNLIFLLFSWVDKNPGNQLFKLVLSGKSILSIALYFNMI